MRSGEAIWVSNAGALMPRVTQRITPFTSNSLDFKGKMS